MKIILSRKGFDSSSGKMPSPILPDGTLLSLPIPGDINYYEILAYNGKNYGEIIHELSNNKLHAGRCHYDPDIREEAIREAYRPTRWKPTFGQTGAALKHLQNQNVGIGDLFLFFGLFRECEIINGKYQFLPGSVPKHIIWGYLQVGEILYNPTSEEFPWLAEPGKHQHPHVDRENGSHAIFVASESLSWDKQRKGADCLDYDEKRVLTKKGMKPSFWDLPDFFNDIRLSYHNETHRKNEYFQSAGRGQEFVFSVNNNVDIMKWVSNIIDAKPPRDKRTRITPEHITSLMSDEIFVFGSNREGAHMGGAARQALQWGAIWGQGEGIQGKTYAIPTMFDTVEEIRPYVNRFIEYAKANPDKRFLVTNIGCGIANFEPKQIAPLFEEVIKQNMKNICLSKEFSIINISALGFGQD